ncbi:predicted protein [Plenodomus lingam JN3]|uniref:Predicted protein n=1 Tax=Leptosphaeria maculans (strain JN3 / isolate v23.1.3 / race Av1-4-5-6-7-8) TaxID=985895 RepID=E5A9Z8_LEPMJ|nr:predicted protein [Plenodomus lingam JN3]CBY00489.1 predicted protein [Plenodomus lingam JN3]
MSPADDEHYRYLAWHPPRAVPTRLLGRNFISPPFNTCGAWEECAGGGASEAKVSATPDPRT